MSSDATAPNSATSDPPAIAVRGLGKAYTISHQGERPKTLLEAAWSTAKRVARRDGTRERFWALQDLSFTVQQGEVVGVVGRNGAGKSTLLKLLSRITEPTTGAIELRGRTGSLLEVGTGFHRELTGRENIYLNGGILGMSRREINQRFDEIVQFAGIERFLDTPVKRYSSGMYVRLAFAVAAHLDTEILIVDEVLAVGDVGFRHKCLDKMGDLAGSGRTVLLVSHDMAAITNLTRRCLFLADGQLKADGEPHDVVHQYRKHLREKAPMGVTEFQPVNGKPRALKRIEVLKQSGEPTPTFAAGEPITIRITLSGDVHIESPQIGLGLDNEDGFRIATLTSYYDPSYEPSPTRDAVYECRPQNFQLNQGTFFLTVTVSDGTHDRIVDRVEHSCQFEVTAADYFNTGWAPGKQQGVVLVKSAWSVRDPADIHPHRAAQPADQRAGGSHA